MAEVSKTAPTNSRFEVLDHLRGYFIIVIIIDHLSRWPSILSAITGKAWLWVTAAEGFVAISGLLVGYVRGYKNRSLPMKDVAKKLVGRGLLLYLWAIIGSIIYTAILWYVPLQGGAPGLPLSQGDWTGLILQTITLQYTFVWVYFLALYAVYLAVSPLAILLLRRNKAWLLALLSFGLLVLGWQTQSMLLQWQFLFFVPMIAGYYLDAIMAWWQRVGQARRRVMASGIISLTAGTVTASVLATFWPEILGSLSATLNDAFAKDTISLWRAAMAFLWFTGFVLLFAAGHRFMKRLFGWLLIPIGTHSLTAYIVHGLVICIVSFLTVASANIWINTLLGVAAVLAVWGILKIPGINNVIPR